MGGQAMVGRLRRKWSLLACFGCALMFGSAVYGGAFLFGSAGSRAASGRLDPTFGHGGKVVANLGLAWSSAAAVALQDRKIVVAGGDEELVLARLSPRGRLDSRFGVGGSIVRTFRNYQAWGLALAIQPDGKLVVAGTASTTTNKVLLARFNPNGSRDRSFGVHGIVLTSLGADSTSADAVAVQPDGKIVVGGDGGHGRNGPPYPEWAVARFTSRGMLDRTFGDRGVRWGHFSNGWSSAAAIAIDGQGRVVVGGTSRGRAIRRGFALTRLEPNGSTDQSFGTDGETIVPTHGGGDGALDALAVGADGSIVAAGSTAVRPDYRPSNFAVMRLTPGGLLDPTFGPGGVVITHVGTFGSASSVVRLPGGGIAAVGWSARGPFSNLRKQRFEFTVVRYGRTGALDTSFGHNGIVWTRFRGRYAVANAALVMKGKLVAAGSAGTGLAGNGNARIALVRYLMK